MTDKDRKARDERVKLRGEVERWKRDARAWAGATRDAKDKMEQLESRLNELRQAYDTLCASLGKGGST